MTEFMPPVTRPWAVGRGRKGFDVLASEIEARKLAGWLAWLDSRASTPRPVIRLYSWQDPDGWVLVDGVQP